MQQYSLERKDRWYWHRTIQDKGKITLEENRQCEPAVAYCRYADHFVIAVKGTQDWRTRY
jgi:RNA-directed DNA polymerase